MKPARNLVLGSILCLLTLGCVWPCTAECVEYTPNDATQSTELQVTQKITEAQAPEVVPQKSIRDMVDEYLERSGVYEGWNEDKQVYVSIGEAAFDSEDPSYDDTFITKRSLKSMEAVLDGKSRIIEFIRTEMSVMDEASTPGTDLNALFKEELDKLERKMEAQRARVAKLLAEVDASEANVLQGITFGDRFKALMDAAIKKLDGKYSSQQIADEKKKRYEEVKARYAEAQNDYQRIESELKTRKGAKQETLSSKVETMSSMPLLGATTCAQFEAWDETEQRYRIAIITLWSKKMESVVRSFLKGEPTPVPPGKCTLSQWVKGNNWATSTGGRRFRDNQGQVHFIGIGAAAVGGSASSEKRGRGIAEQIAKKEVATAIFADVSSHKVAEQMMETYSGTEHDTSAAAESYASTLKQSIEGRHINGIQRIYGNVLKHPLSGQNIYVAIYAASGSSARDALFMEESNYISRILDIKAQQTAKGTKAGHEEAIDRAEHNTSAYTTAKTTSATGDQTAAGGNNPTQQNHQAPAGSSPANGGAYSGAGQDDMVW
ncbi:hypothetical protein GGQ74_002172 [Desulfobaculum xiamenense]|uniref:LPP20 lipoprotein n=1 Tax=Desulfobaculum xiamenense TaxID=995050 RepID=A0A846QV27_9BACT|nr:hypothetical protein [Desulfobaculum xiamenense]NJB68499.1 hypothetical protein [Desulfobaculum xiamenense]